MSTRTRHLILLLLPILSSTSLTLSAQFRNYTIVYTDNARGNITTFGNTLMAISDNNAINTLKMNDNAVDGNSSYGNDNENMQYVDVDGNSLSGAGTRNSSSADLILPSGTNTIKLARLYWGGRVKDSDFDLTQPANQKIKIRKGAFVPYIEFTATQIDKDNFVQNNENYTRYQAYADITSFIQTNGAGTYFVGNAPLSVGAIDNGGNYGGWCIVIVYENPSFNYNSIRLYDGFQQVFNNGNPLTTSFTLTGLDAPSGALASSDAKMGVITWEGDANLTGDFLKINGNLFSNGINPSNNPWNGTISDNGVHITTKNPNFTNQMGIDIDGFDVGTGYGILPNATSVTLEFGTEADQYFPGIVSFVMRMKDPAITLDKTVVDLNLNGKAEVGEVLFYTLKGKNTGTGNANKVVINDTLPSTVTYGPNSLQVINSPGIAAGLKTDVAGDDVAEVISSGSKQIVRFRIGTGANSIDGGTLLPGETYQVQFQVMVNNPGAGRPVPAIINTARIIAISDANQEFTDDGTAIINPEAGALPVILTTFNAILQNREVKLSWETSMEINCKSFDVERSIDGINFIKVTTVPGNGTTSIVHDYSFLDEIGAVPADVVYYRLKQNEIDNRFNYSNILAVRLSKENRQLTISPVPFKNNFNIQLLWNRDETALLRIINSSGEELIRKNIQLIKGSNYYNIDGSRFAAGNYFLEIASPNEKVSQKIVKE